MRAAGSVSGPVRCRESGVAIISVLLIVTLVTLMVSSLFWRETVTVRSIQNRSSMAQVRWVESAVLDWAEVVLRVDKSNTGAVDHLQEVWALPVAETRLDETVTGGARLGDQDAAASITGQVFDAQSRLNLNNLIIAGKASDVHLQAFERLLRMVDRPQSLASALQARLQLAYPPVIDGRRVPASALPLLKVSDLRTVPGFDDATIQALGPFVVFLPKTIRLPDSTVNTENSKVNINTAAPEVLAAVIPDIDLAAARQFTEGPRERNSFASLDAARSSFANAPTLQPNLLSVGSDFFLVAGVVRFDRVEAQSESLMYRGTNRVERVWQHRF
jgi:general secretion pathway protein K